MERKEAITVRLGKNGVTPRLINELRTILAKHKRVKVKMLKTSLSDRNKDEVAAEIKEKTRSRRAKLIGHTLSLEK